jgi:hypothetical protein
MIDIVPIAFFKVLETYRDFNVAEAAFFIANCSIVSKFILKKFI